MVDYYNTIMEVYMTGTEYLSPKVKQDADKTFSFKILITRSLKFVYPYSEWEVVQYFIDHSTLSSNQLHDALLQHMY